MLRKNWGNSFFNKRFLEVEPSLCIPPTVNPSSRLWVLRLQCPASLYATSVLSSRWFSSFSFSLFVLDWLAVGWFVILPVEITGCTVFSVVLNSLANFSNVKTLYLFIILKWSNYVHFQLSVCILRSTRVALHDKILIHLILALYAIPQFNLCF